jgi:hypothetical protein
MRADRLKLQISAFRGARPEELQARCEPFWEIGRELDGDLSSQTVGAPNDADEEHGNSKFGIRISK